ncbi:uncharacterized protein LOC132584505 [Heteronotia binoei]|uniref:uncharacterized protein LOC132584505 n=1 Tax=Heteronotia binoei TaxID=13085 RepID=UPI00292CB4B0|nr:uncharacterized protein LOC132584505 [Heteronotia binoei]
MEDSSEFPDNPSHEDKPAPACFAPRISEGTAQFLVNTIAGTAKMVQAAVEAHKSAQLACFNAEQSLGQAQLSYLAARGLCERLVGLSSLPDYQGIFQHMSHPPMPYSEFCTIIRRTESALLHPIQEWKPRVPTQRDLSPGSECSCPPDTSEDSFLGGIQELRLFRSPGVSETQDEDMTDEEESRSLHIRGRNPSRHKQVETVLLEDQMGDTYVTQRRRSPRRSPSAGMEGLSPLVSEQDLSTIQPLICCPSRQGGSGKFLSKVTRRKDQPQLRQNSDSDTDQSENSAKDTVST